jgi:hypothetical protein
MTLMHFRYIDHTGAEGNMKNQEETGKKQENQERKT